MSAVPLDDVQQVLVVVAILYVLELAWWLRGPTWRFFASPFLSWSDTPADDPETTAWRVTFSNPLPWTTAHAGEPFPFPLDGDRLLVPVVDPRTGAERFRPTRFDSIERVSCADRDVLIDGRVIGRFSSRPFAEITASRLERLRSTPAASRGGEADTLIAAMHDVRAASARLHDWWTASAVVRHLGGVLTLTVLLLAPIVWTMRAGLSPHLPLAVLVLSLALWFVTAAAAFLIPRRELVKSGAPVAHRSFALLSPVAAMRLADTLGRDALVEFSPLVVALAVAGRTGAVGSDVVAAHLRRVIHPARLPAIDAAGPGEREEASRTLRWYLERTAHHSLEAVKSVGLDPRPLLVPEPGGPDARSYCPRCGRTFVQPAGICDVCDLTLVAWARAPVAVPPAGGDRHA